MNKTIVQKAVESLATILKANNVPESHGVKHALQVLGNLDNSI